MHVRISVRIEAGDGEAPIGIAATVFAPAQLPEGRRPVALFCFPGGGMSQLYFDLDEHSFARAMTEAGLVTVTFDHPGIGKSDAPSDGFSLTARRIAAIEAQAATKIAGRLRNGTIGSELPPLNSLTMIGLGHSMGAMLVSLQQAAMCPYAALALLGFSTRGLPEVLTPAEQSAAKYAVRDDTYYIAMARQRFGDRPYMNIPSRTDGSAELKAASAPLLTVAAMQSMLPGNIAADAATISVPIFLAVGDRDITGRPEAIAPRFSSAPDIRLLVMENAGHHPFVAPSATMLYADLAEWAFAIARAP